MTEVISKQAVLEMAYDMSEIDGEHFTEPWMVVDVEDIQKLPPITPIPDNATNGDVIQALFPNIDKGFSKVADWNLWWNAPYETEREE